MAQRLQAELHRREVRVLETPLDPRPPVIVRRVHEKHPPHAAAEAVIQARLVRIDDPGARDGHRFLPEESAGQRVGPNAAAALTSAAERSTGRVHHAKSGRNTCVAWISPGSRFLSSQGLDLNRSFTVGGPDRAGGALGTVRVLLTATSIVGTARFRGALLRLQHRRHEPRAVPRRRRRDRQGRFRRPPGDPGGVGQRLWRRGATAADRRMWTEAAWWTLPIS